MVSDRGGGVHSALQHPGRDRLYVRLAPWGCCFSIFVHYTGKKVKAVYPVVVIGSGLVMLICALLLLYGAANAIYAFML